MPKEWRSTNGRAFAATLSSIRDCRQAEGFIVRGIVDPGRADLLPEDPLSSPCAPPGLIRHDKPNLTASNLRLSASGPAGMDHSPATQGSTFQMNAKEQEFRRSDWVSTWELASAFRHHWPTNLHSPRPKCHTSARICTGRQSSLGCLGRRQQRPDWQRSGMRHFADRTEP